MSGRALISGQAGVAVLLHGGRAQSFHLDGTAGIDRSLEEIPQMFGDCTDVVVVEGIEHEAVSTRLELEWAKQRCLSLCLFLLDIESHSESRLIAIPDIEEFLGVPEVGGFLRARLFVAPMPDNADLIGAMNRAHGEKAVRLVGILEEVGGHQAEIDQCRSAWDALPAQTFRDESSKESAAFALVQAGAFYQVVTTVAEKRGALLVKLLVQPEFQKWRIGITSWINSLSLRNRGTNRAVDEEETSRRRRRSVKQTRISSEARLDVVNRQKDAIRKALAVGDLKQARAFCGDLLAHQERNSRPEHIAKSLCDLAQSAKELGYHQLQLEWTQKAVDVAPGDGWSLAQLGDAHRCLGQWSEAETAFALAIRHGEVRVARTGRAEVLKGMGRLEDALREYEATAKEFPQNVVARTGAASVCVLMADYELATGWIGPLVNVEPVNWVGLHILGMIHLRTGRADDAIALFERGLREGPFEDRRFFRSGLAYARLLVKDLDQAASILEDEPSVVSRVLQIHIYGELDQTEKARRAYDIVRSNRNPRVIELTAELVARARLEKRAPARSDQWVLDREFELLLAA
jgi:tetratricopeptide (TPR) repeat protein